MPKSKGPRICKHCDKWHLQNEFSQNQYKKSFPLCLVCEQNNINTSTTTKIGPAPTIPAPIPAPSPPPHQHQQPSTYCNSIQLEFKDLFVCDDGCFSTARALLSTHFGTSFIEKLERVRVQCELELVSRNWNDRDARQSTKVASLENFSTILEQCQIFHRITCFLLPAETYMQNAPQRQLNETYHHAFTIFPSSNEVVIVDSCTGSRQIRFKSFSIAIFQELLKKFLKSKTWGAGFHCYTTLFGTPAKQDMLTDNSPILPFLGQFKWNV